MLERIHNHDPGAGLSASLKLAVCALPSTARGAVILLGDMPRIAPSLIDRLIDAFDAAPVEPLAIVPVRGGRRGNPAPQVLLAHHLRQLKLPTFLREYEKLATEAARGGCPSV